MVARWRQPVLVEPKLHQEMNPQPAKPRSGPAYRQRGFALVCADMG